MKDHNKTIFTFNIVSPITQIITSLYILLTGITFEIIVDIL